MNNSHTQTLQSSISRLTQVQSSKLTTSPLESYSPESLDLLFKIKNKRKPIFKLMKRASTTTTKKKRQNSPPPSPPSKTMKKSSSCSHEIALTSAAIAALTQNHHLHFLQENNLSSILNIPFQLNNMNNQDQPDQDASINGNPSQTNNLDDEEQMLFPSVLASTGGSNNNSNNNNLFDSVIISDIFQKNQQTFPQQAECHQNNNNTNDNLSYYQFITNQHLFDDPPAEIEICEEMISSDNSKCKILDSQRGEQYNRREKSLEELSKKFLTIFLQREQMMISLDKITQQLDVERRRIYDIINILESLKLVTRRGKNNYKWNGFDQIFETITQLSEQQEDIDTLGCEMNEKKEKSLEVLSIGFLKLFLNYKETLSLEEAARKLSPLNCESQKIKTKIRRLYDIANVFKSLGLIRKVSLNKTNKPAFQWIGLSGLHEFYNSSKDNSGACPNSPQIADAVSSPQINQNPVRSRKSIQLTPQEEDKASLYLGATKLVNQTSRTYIKDKNNMEPLKNNKFQSTSSCTTGCLNRSNNSAFKTVNRKTSNSSQIITNATPSCKDASDSSSKDIINNTPVQNINSTVEEVMCRALDEENTEEKLDEDLTFQCINMFLKLFKGEESNNTNGNSTLDMKLNTEVEESNALEEQLNLLNLFSSNSEKNKITTATTMMANHFTSSVNSAFHPVMKHKASQGELISTDVMQIENAAISAIKKNQITLEQSAGANTQEKETSSPASSDCLSPNSHKNNKSDNISINKNSSFCTFNTKKRTQILSQGSATTSASTNNSSDSKDHLEIQQILVSEIPQQQLNFDEILPNA